MKIIYALFALTLIVLAGCSSTPAPTGGGTPTETFAITGGNYQFTMDGQQNPDLHVKQGDHVRVLFTSDNGFHDFVIDELGVKTARLQTGKSETVDFVADKTGTFAYYCSVGNHRQMGMTGNITIS